MDIVIVEDGMDHHGLFMNGECCVGGHSDPII